MQPTFKTSLDWEKANRLMQPVFIRVIDNLRKTLETSDWQGTYQEIQHPYPGYHLHLTHLDHAVTVDIWKLCFKICFLNYASSIFVKASEASLNDTEDVEVDERLLDENGDVDWQQLETKTQYQINYLFANLPSHLEP